MATDKKIDHIKSAILATKKSEGELLFDLGVAYVYLNAPPGVHYCAPYNDIGKKLWHAIQYEVYNFICDAKKKEPHPWIQELISGDIRNLLTGIITALVSTLSVPLAIAIPAAALITKKGVTKYCKLGKPSPPQKRLATFLKAKNKKPIKGSIRHRR